ncbi:MerR family transcriptional regulator [bacterium]|nr:MerR family transcriptional regulator [bacterium]
MKKKSYLRIGELSERVGVTPRTIRFYVEQRLIREPVKTQKNLAHYPPDVIEKIRAIKRAQKDRYLPLMVIRRILESNGFDYDALGDAGGSDGSGGATAATRVTTSSGSRHLPDSIRAELLKRKWIGTFSDTGVQDGPHGIDQRFMQFLEAFNHSGLDWSDLLASLEGIESLVGQIVDLEFRTLLQGAIRHTSLDFGDMLELEADALQQFMIRIRQVSLKKRIARFQKSLDYVFLASADEGFLLPQRAIQCELEAMENRLQPRLVDIRLLNDLALGYSCVGDIETSLRYLRRVKRKYPRDLETQVRWIWYRRFAGRNRDQKRLRQQLEKLVAENPDNAIGRAFLAIWYYFDLARLEDPFETLRLMNRSLQEIAAALQNMTEANIQEWVLIHYIEGRLFMNAPAEMGLLQKGIAAFEMILNRKRELDLFYRQQVPFFSKWLWPNLLYFLGLAHARAGAAQVALGYLKAGRSFQVLPPYQERIEEEIRGLEHNIKAS